MDQESKEKTTQFPSPGAKLALALSKAQSEIKAPIKNRHVDFTHNGQRTKYSYADLADVIEAVKGPLTKNELAVSHVLCYEGDMYGLKTILMHSSGEFMDTWYPLPDPMKQNIRAQQFGSALTYARRYSLSSIVGIASDEDDDGGSAAETQPPQKPQSAPPPPVKPKNHAPQSKPKANQPPAQSDDLDEALGPVPTRLDEFYAYVEMNGFTNETVKQCISLACGGVKKSTELSVQEIDTVIGYLEKMKLGNQ